MTLPTDPTLLLGAGSAPYYNVQKSLRFRSSASAYLSRTPASAGNRKTWTWSAWVKRGTLGATQVLFIGYVDANNKTRIDISSTDILRVYDITGGSTERVKVYTTQVLRDPGSWYHIVVALDTTSATSTITGSSTDRVRLYINGVQVTAFSSTVAPSQNADLYVDATNAHNVGGSVPDALYFDGYLAEVNFIDGQALTPSSFGAYSPYTGVWQPSRYTGTYGTNGFYLPFTNTTSTTTLVADSSGNGNNWTPNNISVAAGVTYDSMIDTPTPYDDGGNGRGNYAVLNPNIVTGASSVLNGNLRYSSQTASVSTAVSTLGMSSGKWYWEVYYSSFGTTDGSKIGICAYNANVTGNFCNSPSTPFGWGYSGFNGFKYNNATGVAYGASYTSGDTVSVAFDADNGNLEFFLNNVSQGVAYSGLAANTYLAAVGESTTTGFSILDVNFGQQPFKYAPPSGFKALNTQNLPTPTIAAGNAYMDTLLYTGNATARSITGLNFQPDFAWIKVRSIAGNHVLTDAVRGTDRQLFSSLTNAEQTSTGGITAFNSNGFSLGTNVSPTGSTNENTQTYVAWNWKANGSGSSNTSGSITSTVSANVTAGFSVVTYTGTGANATVGHGLGVAPSMVIVKNRSAGGAGYWLTWHTGMTSAAYYLALNLTVAQTADATVWNSTAPTSSVFSIGTNTTSNNSGTTFVAYCWAAVAGYSAFGSYTGNGSADGPFVYTGFRPRYVLIKRTDSTGNWFVWDSARDPSNTVLRELYPDSSSAEVTRTGSSDSLDFLSNGFKIRFSSTYADRNASGGTYIYAAFAEVPFKFSLAR